MTPEEIKAALFTNEGSRVRVTYDDGVSESVDVHSIDDEGFVHSRPDQQAPRSARPQIVAITEQLWWTRFDSVTDVQPNGL